MENNIIKEKIENLENRIEKREFIPKTQWMHIVENGLSSEEREKILQNNRRYNQEKQELYERFDDEVIHACGLTNHEKCWQALNKAWYIVQSKRNNLSPVTMQLQVLQELSELADLIL